MSIRYTYITYICAMNYLFSSDDSMCVGSLTDKSRTKKYMRKYEMNNHSIGLQRQWLAMLLPIFILETDSIGMIIFSPLKSRN